MRPTGCCISYMRWRVQSQTQLAMDAFTATDVFAVTTALLLLPPEAGLTRKALKALRRAKEREACTSFYFYSGTLFGGGLALFGLVGNLLSCFVLGPERKKSSTVQSLCLLAIADSMVLLAYSTVFPVQGIFKMACGWACGANANLVGSVYIFETARVFNQVSGFLTMILAWQRYVAVCLPHRAKQLCTTRNVNRMAAVVLVSCVVFYLPNFFVYTLHVDENGRFRSESTWLQSNAYFQMIHSVVLSYLFSYFVPVGSLIFMSIRILANLDASNNSVGAASSRAQSVRKDLTKSLMVIVAVFLVCQSFSPVRRVLMWVYDPFLKYALCGGELFYFSTIPHMAIMFNSSANFVIYILFAKGFRRKIAVLFGRGNSAVEPLTSESSSSKKLSSLKLPEKA